MFETAVPAELMTAPVPPIPVPLIVRTSWPKVKPAASIWPPDWTTVPLAAVPSAPNAPVVVPVATPNLSSAPALTVVTPR